MNVETNSIDYIIMLTQQRTRPSPRGPPTISMIENDAVRVNRAFAGGAREKKRCRF